MALNPKQQGVSCDSAAQTAKTEPCLLSFTQNNIGFYHSTNPRDEDAEDESENHILLHLYV